jgi:MFS family permease
VTGTPVTAEYPTSPLPRPEAGRPGAAGWTRTILLAIAVGVAFADSSIVVLALPDLLSRFDTTIGAVSWVITSYNVTVAVLALVLVPLVAARREGGRRLDPVRLTQIGLVVFCAASLACAVSGDLGLLIGARAVQGAGAALLLAGTVPLLATVAGSPARGAVVWAVAGVMGAALGPALGGALTQVFDWRSIFIAQVPLAAAALLATIRVTVPPPAPVADGTAERRVRLPAGAALALVSAALVGALFLSVVLMIDGWGHAPLLAAAIVSALPAGALLAGPVVRHSTPMVAVCGGVLLVGASLVAMALLPEPSLTFLCIALALCGLGLGLCMPSLTDASLRGPSLAASGTWSVGVRHAGLVLGLVLLTPLLTADLSDVADRAQLAGASALIDAPLSIEDKIAVGQNLEEAIDSAPAGEVPDLRPAIAAGGDPDDPARVALGDRLEELISATITRGFRNAFLLCAALAALALVPVAFLRKGALR